MKTVLKVLAAIFCVGIILIIPLYVAGSKNADKTEAFKLESRVYGVVVKF